MFNPSSMDSGPNDSAGHMIIQAPGDGPSLQQDQEEGLIDPVSITFEELMETGGIPQVSEGQPISTGDENETTTETVSSSLPAANPTNASSSTSEILTANHTNSSQTLLIKPPVVDLDDAPASSPVSALLSPTTKAPTAFPVLGIAETATKVISSDPVYLRITGNFNPGQEEAIFFDVLEDNFEPYGKAYVGADTLKDLDLQVEFFPDAELSAQQRQKTTEEVAATWAEILITFHVSLDNDMDSDQASQIVRRFFVASHKERFVGQLEDAGVGVANMLVFDDIPDEIKASRGQIVFNDDFFSDNAVPSFEGADEVSTTTTNRSSAIVAAILSGGIILLALCYIILSNRRRHQQGFSHLDVNKEGDIEYDNMSSDSNSNRMGMYHSDHEDDDENDNSNMVYDQPSERNGEPYFQSVMSCNSSVSSYPSKVKYQSPADQMLQPTECMTDQEEIVEERALVVIDDTPDLIAAAALANEHPAPLQQQHPAPTPGFLDKQAETPPSPIWSLDNFSNGTPYSVADEHTDVRRRWQEASTDVDSIGVPDHYSAQEQGNRSVVDNEEETDEGSGRGIV